MNPLSPVRRVLSRMRFRSTVAGFFHWLTAGRIDWRREAGDPLENSIVAATLLWIARTFPEAPPALDAVDLTTGVETAVIDHPLLRKIQQPNAYYTGAVLWMATVTDFWARGDAYWLIIPTAGGDVAEIWWVPSWMMEPVGSDTTFIDHYDYTVEGTTYSLDPSRVVHFRYGLDPENDRKGCSPLRSVLREVFTDNEASAYTAAILRNMGVPGIVVSPEKGESVDEDTARKTKEKIAEQVTGDRRGEPIVMKGATRVEQFGFSPEQLNLKELRRIPEERISAVTGIPAMVVGLGAGLDRSTFTNMGEAREAAYEAGLIPAQRILSEDIRFQLLGPWYERQAVHAFRFRFDLSKVRVLQEDLYRLAQRHDLAIRGGWEMVAEGRRALGLPVEDTDFIYLRGANLVEVPGGENGDDPPRPLAPSSTNGNGTTNGNGNGALAGDVAREVVAAMERDRLREGGKAA